MWVYSNQTGENEVGQIEIHEVDVMLTKREGKKKEKAKGSLEKSADYEFLDSTMPVNLTHIADCCALESDVERPSSRLAGRGPIRMAVNQEKTALIVISYFTNPLAKII